MALISQFGVNYLGFLSFMDGSHPKHIFQVHLPCCKLQYQKLVKDIKLGEKKPDIEGKILHGVTHMLILEAVNCAAPVAW